VDVADEAPQPHLLQVAHPLRRVPLADLEQVVVAARAAGDLPLVQRHGGEERAEPERAPAAIALDRMRYRVRLDVRLERVGDRALEEVVFEERLEDVEEDARDELEREVLDVRLAEVAVLEERLDFL